MVLINVSVKNSIKTGLSLTASLLAFIMCGHYILSAQVHCLNIIPDIGAGSPGYLYAGQHDSSYIHYVDIEPDTVMDTPWDYGLYFDLDLNDDDTMDYQFYCHSGGGVGFGGSSSSVKGLNENNMVVTATEHPDWVKKFDYGDTITFEDEEIPSEYCIYCSYFYSEWENYSSGYWWGEDPDNYTGLIMFQGGDTIMAWVKVTASAGYLKIMEYAWMYYPPSATHPDDSSCELSVYPMPVDDQFYIQTCLPSQECDIYIYDLAGHVVTSFRLAMVSNEPATVDLGTLRQGIYVLKVMFEEQTISRKITVMI